MAYLTDTLVHMAETGASSLIHVTLLVDGVLLRGRIVALSVYQQWLARAARKANAIPDLLPQVADELVVLDAARKEALSGEYPIIHMADVEVNVGGVKHGPVDMMEVSAAAVSALTYLPIDASPSS